MAAERGGERTGRRTPYAAAKFCPACGEALRGPTSECPHCGATILWRGEPFWKSWLREKLPPPTTLLPVVTVLVVCGGAYFLEKQAAPDAVRPAAESPAEPSEIPAAPAGEALPSDAAAEPPVVVVPSSVSHAAEQESPREPAVRATETVVTTRLPRVAVKPPTVRPPVRKSKSPSAPTVRTAAAARSSGPSFMQVRSAMNKVKATDSRAWQKAAGRFVGKRVRWRGRVVSIEPENGAYHRLRVDVDRSTALFSTWDVEGVVPSASARRLSRGDEVILEGVIRSVDWSIGGMSVELSRMSVRKVG